ncbi:MAG: hypothetical protein U0Z53_07280 [Blastocatellia bacterium]
MNHWIEGGLLLLALIAGTCAGWIAGRRAGLRLPNVWVSLLVLLAGSLGGPLLTYRLMGAQVWSFMLALLLSGLAIGLTCWPMSETQGRREW